MAKQKTGSNTPSSGFLSPPPPTVNEQKQLFHKQCKEEVAKTIVKVVFGLGALIITSIIGWGVNHIGVDIGGIINIEFEKPTPSATSTVVANTSTPQVTVTSTVATPSPLPTAIPIATLHPYHTSKTSISAPVLLAPEDHASVKGRPELVWEPMVLPSDHHFRVCLYHKNLESPLEICNETTDYRRMPHNLPARAHGWWDWKVQVVDQYGNVVSESETWGFWYQP